MNILIGGEKGGTGKSCLSQNLAVYLQRKQRDVLLLDADPQGTTTVWASQRSDNPDVTPISLLQASGNIRQTLKDLSSRYQDIVIDAGGQDSEALRSAMTIATHMLIPFRPKRRDLNTLEHIEKLIRLAKAVNPSLQVFAVITQCPTLPNQVQRILDAKDACASFDIPVLSSITMNRNAYDDSEENGLSVLESDLDVKAKIEIEEIALEFLGI